MPGSTGARAREYSSSQITRSMIEAPRPPYSVGHAMPTQPALCIVFCQATRRSNISRVDATRSSAGSSTQRSGGRFASSQRAEFLAERFLLGCVLEVHGCASQSP